MDQENNKQPIEQQPNDQKPIKSDQSIRYDMNSPDIVPEYMEWQSSPTSVRIIDMDRKTKFTIEGDSRVWMILTEVLGGEGFNKPGFAIKEVYGNSTKPFISNETLVYPIYYIAGIDPIEKKGCNKPEVTVYKRRSVDDEQEEDGIFGLVDAVIAYRNESGYYEKLEKEKWYITLRTNIPGQEKVVIKCATEEAFLQINEVINKTLKEARAITYGTE